MTREFVLLARGSDFGGGDGVIVGEDVFAGDFHDSVRIHCVPIRVVGVDT